MICPNKKKKKSRDNEELNKKDDKTQVVKEKRKHVSYQNLQIISKFSYILLTVNIDILLSVSISITNIC